MSAAVQALLESFDALSEPERHEAAVELLRRITPHPELSDEALIAAADEIFCEMDLRESTNARA